jgi:replicative DNA helicase
VVMKTLMENDDGLRQLGGPAYLVRLAGSAISPNALRDYAEMIVELWQRRVMLETIEEAKGEILGGSDIMEVQAKIEVAGQKLAAADAKRPTSSFLSSMTDALEMTFGAYQGQNSGLQIGIPSLDALIGGLFPEEMIILAAAPSMGKTTLAVEIARHIAKQDVGVAFVSLEMSDVSITQRILSAETRIPYRSFRRGDITEAEGRKLIEHSKRLESLPIHYVGAQVRDIASIFASARRIQRHFSNLPRGMGLLVVDYLQLVRAPGRDRFQQVTEVSMGLKSIARQLKVPVLALAQVNNKALMDRDDKRPRVSDLRESGQIEQDADIVLLAHRDHYYLEREGPPKDKGGKVKVESLADYESAKAACKNQVDVILAKHRHDGVGEVKLGISMDTSRLWDLQNGDLQSAMGFQ